jgi:hypothetical protein
MRALIPLSTRSANSLGSPKYPTLTSAAVAISDAARKLETGQELVHGGKSRAAFARPLERQLFAIVVELSMK